MKNSNKKLRLITILSLIIVIFAASKWICWYIPDKFCVNKDTGDVVVGILAVVIALVAISMNRNK
ncbi:MAG: hypothetical protein HKP42_06155 [Maribacter sp.]|nr:hypothetical protein [Maribacter sp.]